MITMTVCLLCATELSDISVGLLHPYRNFGYLRRSLTTTQKFWISPRVSYTHSEILDNSTSLLHPHRNSGYLHGSLTPTKKFWISTRVSYTHIEILVISTGLLHPYRIFRILPQVSFTHIGPFEYYRRSPSPYFKAFHLRRLTAPFLLCPTHIFYFSFPNLNYESSLDVVPKTNPIYTHQE